MDAELQACIDRREVVLAGVVSLLVEQLHVARRPEEIDPDTPLFGTGLGLDSVDAVELVVSLETVFGLTIQEDTDARMAMRTVNTLVDAVLARREVAHAG